MGPFAKTLLAWLAAALVIFLFWSASSRIQKSERALTFSDFVAQLEAARIERVTLTATGRGSEIVGTFKNGQAFRTFAPPETGHLVDIMLEQGVELNARDANRASWLGHIVSWTPIVIMIAFLIFFMRTMHRAGTSRFATTPSERLERRLATKAQFFDALFNSKGDLSLGELRSSLGERSRSDDEEEVRKALYEMLSDGVVLLTTDRKYRLRTTL